MDGTIPSLALMKLSAWQKGMGNKVAYYPSIKFYRRKSAQVHFASLLFSRNKATLPAGVIAGGPGYDPRLMLPREADESFPDYSIYPELRESFGYTYRACSRRCSFCCVGKSPLWNDTRHHSIYSFHPRGWTRINLLNNNTLQDPRWTETFEEIGAAGLTVFDHNGYDVRLLDEAKARLLGSVKWGGLIHFAFDRMEDEAAVIKGADLAARYIGPRRCCFYVLVGYDTTLAQDLYRVSLLRKMGFWVFVMMYRRTDELRRLARWCNNKMFFLKVPYEEYDETLSRPRGRSRPAPGAHPASRDLPDFEPGSASKFYRVRTGREREDGRTPKGVRRGLSGRWEKLPERARVLSVPVA